MFLNISIAILQAKPKTIVMESSVDPNKKIHFHVIQEGYYMKKFKCKWCRNYIDKGGCELEVCKHPICYNCMRSFVKECIKKDKVPKCYKCGQIFSIKDIDRHINDTNQAKSIIKIIENYDSDNDIDSDSDSSDSDTDDSSSDSDVKNSDTDSSDDDTDSDEENRKKLISDDDSKVCYAVIHVRKRYICYGSPYYAQSDTFQSFIKQC